MAEEKDTAAEDTAPATDESGDSVLEEAARKVREQQEDKVPHKIAEEKPLPDSRKELLIEIPREEWERRLGNLFKELQQNAAVEGFRKGKAPLKLLHRRYMKEANEDVAEKVLTPIMRDYQEERKTTVYGTPVVKDAKYDGDPVALTVEIEVKPELVPENYTGHEVEVGEMRVTDQMVEMRMREMLEKNSHFEEVSRTLAAGDGIVVDMKIVDAKGQTVTSVNNHLIEMPQETLPEAVWKELEGKQAGDSIDLKAPSMRNQAEQWQYIIAIKSVKELKKPELDDEFAKDLGYDNLAGMRSAIQADYQRMVESLQRDEAFENLMKKLVEMHSFEVPKTLQAVTERNMLQSDLEFMRYTGDLPERLRGKSKEQYSEELEANALLRVKSYLLADAIGKKENLEATDADIDAALEERAKSEGRKPVAIRAALERKREWDSFVSQVRFDKVRGFLLSSTKVKFVERKEEPPAAAE